MSWFKNCLFTSGTFDQRRTPIFALVLFKKARRLEWQFRSG